MAPSQTPKWSLLLRPALLYMQPSSCEVRRGCLCLPLMALPGALQRLRWEVIIAEDHLVVIVAIVLREELLGAQEVVRLQDKPLPDLQREDVLVRIRGDAAGAV